MAYLFGAATTDNIACGGGNAITRAATGSLFLRFQFTQNLNLSNRRLVLFSDTGLTVVNAFLQSAAGGNNRLMGGGTIGGSFSIATAAAGLNDTNIHTAVLTFDASNINLYQDTSATPVGTVGIGAGMDTTGTQLFVIGNLPGGASESPDATIYEVGWWASTVLTGAQAAAMGSGTPPATNPTHYWPLVSDAVALFGGVNGTVTGASVVAHSGTNLYSGGAQALTATFTSAPLTLAAGNITATVTPAGGGATYLQVGGPVWRGSRRGIGRGMR